MAAVTAAVVGATVGAASLANSIEQANQQKRLAGQVANAARSDADRAAKQMALDDANASAQKQANAARLSQRNRIPGAGAGQAMGQPQTAAPTLLSTQPAPQTTGSGTLLGQ